MQIRVVALFGLCLMMAAGSSFGWEPNSKDKMELGVAEAILNASEKDPDLAKWFESAAGYAVFPSVKKGGIGFGGARGKGLMIQGDNTSEK